MLSKLTPHQRFKAQVIQWVREHHGDRWYFSVGRDGTIKKRLHSKGHIKKKILGHVRDIPPDQKIPNKE